MDDGWSDRSGMSLTSNPICWSLPVVARWWSRPHSAHNGCGSVAFSPRRQRQSPGSLAVLSPSFRFGLIRVAQNARPNDSGCQYLPLPKSTDGYLKTFSLFFRFGTTQSWWLDGSTSSERRGSTGTASLEMPPPRPTWTTFGKRYLLVPRRTLRTADDGVLVARTF